MAGADSTSTTTTAERPRGLYGVRVDAKGRLKLPAAFKEYFEKKEEKKFFITTMDKKLVHIYPIAMWQANEQKLLQATTKEELQATKALRWVANKYGADATMDADGRMLVPQELRAELNLNDAPIWLQFEGDKVLGYNQAQYDANDQAYGADLEAQLELMQMKGLA